MPHLKLCEHVFKLQIDFYCAFTTDSGLRARGFQANQGFIALLFYLFTYFADFCTRVLNEWGNICTTLSFTFISCLTFSSLP